MIIQFEDLMFELTHRINAQIIDVLEHHPVAKHNAFIQSCPATSGYKYSSYEIDRLYSDIVEHFGIDALDNYKKLIIIDAINGSLKRITRQNLTSEVRQLSIQNFQRIIDNFSKEEFAYSDFPVDRFHKDLAAATLRLLCAGVCKIHPTLLQRGLIKRDPIAWIRCHLSIGLGGKLFEMHMDSNDQNSMADFHEDGWILFYKRVAALLEISPSFHGIYGSTWFFDPELKAISPRLAYLRSLITDNGGFSFKIGTSKSDIENATRTSKTRRDLVEQGRYTPTSYALIWLRNDIMAWSKTL